MTRNVLRMSLLISALAMLFGAGGASAESEPSKKAAAQDAGKADKSTAGRPLKAITVKPGDIAKTPVAYFGKEVKVTADVATVFGQRVFTLDEDKIGVGPDVLVLLPNLPSVPIGPDARVTVTGAVRQFVDADIYMEHGWFDDADARIVHELHARPVVVARKVQLSNGIIALQPGMKMADDPRPIGATAGDIAENPMLYFGRKVTINAEVDDVKDARSFTLDEDRLGVSPDVLVLNPEGLAGPREGERVTVTGIVRPFVDTSLRRDFDWFDATPGFTASFEGRPVVVAEELSSARGSNSGRGN